MLPLPANYAQAVSRAEAAPVSPQWWQRFGNAELDRLIAEALAETATLAGLVRDNQDQVSRLRRIAALQTQWNEFAQAIVELTALLSESKVQRRIGERHVRGVGS